MNTRGDLWVCGSGVTDGLVRGSAWCLCRWKVLPKAQLQPSPHSSFAESRFLCVASNSPVTVTPPLSEQPEEPRLSFHGWKPETVLCPEPPASRRQASTAAPSASLPAPGLCSHSRCMSPPQPVTCCEHSPESHGKGERAVICGSRLPASKTGCDLEV